MNFVAGQTTPNLVTVQVGAGGKVDLYNGSAGTTQLIADVEGYYVAGGAHSGYTAYGPQRLPDTRNGTGGISSPLTSAKPVVLKVGGVGQIPAGVTAVALNVTLADTSGFGNVAVTPDQSTPSGTSNLNYTAGQTVANMVVATVGPDGAVDFVKQGPGSVSLIADVSGYYTASGGDAFVPLNPTRELDTRVTRWPLTSSQPTELSMDALTTELMREKTLPYGAAAAVLNLTLADTTGFGNVVAYPAGQPAPNTSNLDYVGGQTVTNLAVVPLGSCTPNSPPFQLPMQVAADFAKQGPGQVDLIADLFGYFA